MMFLSPVASWDKKTQAIYCLVIGGSTPRLCQGNQIKVIWCYVVRYDKRFFSQI